MEMQRYERSVSDFTLAYDGEGLADHTMNTQDLVLALSAADDLIRHSNAVVNPNIATSSLRIRTHHPGSFEVEFLLSIVPVFAAGFGGDQLAYATNLLRLLFGSSAPGLLTLLKRLRGRTPTLTESPDGKLIVEAGQIRVGDLFEAEDFRAEVPIEVVRLLADTSVRKAASNLVSPLQRDGIDSMQVREGAEELESFTSDDVHAFLVPAEESVLGSTISHQFLKIDTTRFSTRSRQWRFHDGSKLNSYRMLDDDFITSVVQGRVSFSAGQIFECEVRATQRLGASGDIKTELEILRVIRRHLPNGEARQGQLH